ncbi:hypothetical protein E8E13_002864 [Curvularia kusanoi]|uniref:Transmembrane protein n=1 Tax=Curvularia kusanoi TaxID=90978 RepID=A0A9P4T5V1_CURKU|nr:hypothetical protein E8E13_002864 [Curvularia kusanoi]
MVVYKVKYQDWEYETLYGTAIRRSQVVAAVAAILGALLTVFVSGLYGITSHESSTMADLKVNSTWNNSWIVECRSCNVPGYWLDENPYQASSGDASASYILKHLTWNNMSEGSGAFEDLAFPSLSGLNEAIRLGKYQAVETVLPARRAILDCQSTASPIEGPIRVQGTTRLGTDSDRCAAHIDTSPLREWIKMTTYGGQIWDLYYNDSKDPFHPGVEDVQIDMRDPLLYGEYKGNRRNGQGCPSIFIALKPPPPYSSTTARNGTKWQNLTTRASEVSALWCTQRIQELNTTVKLTLPDLNIDPAHRPVPYEDSIRWIGGQTEFPVVRNLRNLSVVTSNSTYNTDAATLGNFFAAIVYGKNGIPLQELAGSANLPRLANATSKMYGRYMAQVMSAKFRKPLPTNGTEPAKVLKATLSKPQPRLVQYRIPKVALQTLLGIMMLCGILGWVLMPNVKILPHDPCSIAGTAFLLAGEEFWGIKQDWDNEQMFRLERRNGRFGIYAVGAGSRQLVE